jgi:hypothetical protein
MFKSFEHLKAAAEKFSKGKIVPNRVLYSGSHKYRHRVVFACDVYRISVNSRSIFFADIKTGTHAVKFNCDIGKIHLEGRGNYWFSFNDDVVCIDDLNDCIKKVKSYE